MILAPVASIEPGAQSKKGGGGGVILPPDPFRTFHILKRKKLGMKKWVK